MKGSGSIKTVAENLSFGGYLFTLNAGKEVKWRARTLPSFELVA